MASLAASAVWSMPSVMDALSAANASTGVLNTNGAATASTVATSNAKSVNKSLPMKRDVTNRETMLELQGDLVLVNPGKDELLLTIVRLVDINKQELLLVDRGSKARDTWTLTQELCDRLTPSKDPQAKWALIV